MHGTGRMDTGSRGSADDTVALAYNGDYSPDAQRHSAWLRYSGLF